MAETTVTADQIADFLRRKGRAGSQTLSILGKYRPFVEAINSELGKEILRDAIVVHESLLQKVADLTATPEETMEYSALRKIIMRWSDRIAKYEKNLAELKT